MAAKDKERFQSPGDFFVDGVMIVGSSGLRVNVTDQIRELNIYQNLNSPYMSGNLLLADSEGVAELLPLLGQERLLFSLRTPEHEGKVDFNNYHAIIYNVEKRFHTTEREQSFLLNWTTIDHYKNIRTKISESFKGNISEIVTKILRDENYLGTKKHINIEKTQNIRKFVFPNINPFQAILLVKEEALSEGERAPHFLFYENPEGYHFRSLDSQIGQLGTLNVPHKRTYKYQPPKSTGKSDPDKALNTILSWTVDDNSNSFFNTRHGMYASTLFYHDIFNKNIKEFEYNYTRDKIGKRNSTNQESKNVGSIIAQTKIDMGKKLDEFPYTKIFVHPTASKKLYFEGDDKGSDNNAEEWLQESRSRALEREYFTLKIETYGDTDIMVGDMINVVIPSNKPLAPPIVRASVDPILSGRYIITHLQHLVVPTDQRHIMRMQIMKDSLVSASVVKDLQLPEEKKGKTDIGLKRTKDSLTTRTNKSGT